MTRSDLFEWATYILALGLGIWWGVQFGRLDDRVEALERKLAVHQNDIPPPAPSKAPEFDQPKVRMINELPKLAPNDEP